MHGVSVSWDAAPEMTAFAVGVAEADRGSSGGHSDLSPVEVWMRSGASLASTRQRLSLLGLSTFESRTIGRAGNGLSPGSGLSTAAGAVFCC